MSTTDVRQTAARILDGMTFNKEKLARDCIAVCDTVDRVSAALLQEQQKSSALQRELAAVKAAASNRADASPFPSGMPPGFADAFGDIFKPSKR
jgi:hypothetical protein